MPSQLRSGKKYWSDGSPVGQTSVTGNVFVARTPEAFTYDAGLDLSGSAQGAGGVGGLLAINDVANGVQFAAYDGNGNVSALVKGSDGTISANYEYGPFGESIRATGTLSKANPFRFSTKYQDDETDLIYYGCRHPERHINVP